MVMGLRCYITLNSDESSGWTIGTVETSMLKQKKSVMKLLAK